MMTGVATQVLAIVNAPYGANLAAHELAAMIADPNSAAKQDASVFAFFSEVSAPMQKQFIKDMGVDEAQVCAVATSFSQLSGYALPLAA
jgi:hypothetical protein